MSKFGVDFPPRAPVGRIWIRSILGSTSTPGPGQSAVHDSIRRASGVLLALVKRARWGLVLLTPGTPWLHDVVD
jgi:hypothetical protein